MAGYFNSYVLEKETSPGSGDPNTTEKGVSAPGISIMKGDISNELRMGTFLSSLDRNQKNHCIIHKSMLYV